jgi:DHA2 family multidrug resistance protein
VAGVMLAALLQTVDATIVNVALPNIQGNLGATVDEATWVVTAYVIANVVVIPITPWLQTRLGRKTYFITSITGFTIASILCGLATSLDVLIFFRVVQGAFGGGLLPMSQVILRETFPPHQLGTSQSLFAMGAILGPSIGPTLGGILTDNMSWQWCFDINVVPGILATVLLALYLRNSPPKRSEVDLAGIALLIVAIGSLQYVLDQGQREDWFSSATIRLFTITALAGAAAFVWWELRTPRPIVDLRVLRNRSVAAASLLGAAVASTIYGGLLLLPQFTVEELGFTSTLAGMAIGMRAIPVAVLNMPIGRLVNAGRVDLRLLIGGGMIVSSIGSLWLSRRIATDDGILSIGIPLMLVGFGVAFVFSPLLVSAVRAVAPADGPKAAAFVTLATQLGGSVATASIVTFVDRREDVHQASLAATATLNRAPVAQFFAQHHPVGALYAMVVSQASALSYADAFLVLGFIGILMSPLALALGRKGKA